MSIERSFLRSRNRLEKVFGKWNGHGYGDGNGKGKRKIPPRQNKVLFEPLEPRLLLSSDLTWTAAAGTALDLTLRHQKVDDVETLQLIDNRDQSVLQSQALSETGRVVITGADLDDKLTADFSNPFSVPIIFTDPFANDSDTLEVTGKEDNTWNITDRDKGNVGDVNFTGIEALTGGADADDFVFADGGGVSGVIDGSGGINTLDYSAYTTAVTVNLETGEATGTAGMKNIQNLVGGQGVDTIIGPDTDTTWNITGADTGNVAGIIFAGFENLTGGTGADTFVFADGSSMSGVIDGGGGINSLDYSAYTTDVRVDLGAGTAEGTGGVNNIQNVKGGSGNDILIGNAQTNTLIAGAGDDALTGGPGVDVIDGGSGTDTLAEQRDSDFALTDAHLSIGSEGSDILSNIEKATLTGGASANTFNVSAFTGSVLLSGKEGDDTFIVDLSAFAVDGGAGNDTIVAGDRENTWEITAEDGGLLNGNSFIKVEDLVGGAVADSFMLAAGAMATGLIDGRKGEDKLAGPDTSNIWEIIGSNSWKLNGKTFMDIENLTGGEYEDNFVFGGDGNITGLIDGGGGINTLDYSAYTTDVTVDLGAGAATGTGRISNIQNATGGSGNDTLTGDLADNILIGGGGNDILTGGMGNDILIGGMGDDLYVFHDGWGEDEVIEKVEEGVDTLNFSGVSIPLVYRKSSDNGLDITGGIYSVSASQVENWIGDPTVVDDSSVPQWIPLGPTSITGGQVQGAGGAVIGAVQCIAVKPNVPDTILIGSVNGGIWMTINGTMSTPTWTAVTDQFPSLAIGDIVFDPAHPNIVYAGTGSFSNMGREGGLPVGLLKSTDSGAHWSLIQKPFFVNKPITSVLVLDNGTANGILLVATENEIEGPRKGGVFYSEDGGATFYNASYPLHAGHLPPGPVTDLAVDPANNMIIYAGVPGNDNGVFRSIDYGKTWSKFSGGLPALDDSIRVVLSFSGVVDPSTNKYPLYAAIIEVDGDGNETATGIFRCKDPSITTPWLQITDPPAASPPNATCTGGFPVSLELVDTDKNGIGDTPTRFGVNPGGQAYTNFSLLADPTNPNVIYVAGDCQVGPPAVPWAGNSEGATNYTGRIFKGTFDGNKIPFINGWESMVNTLANNSAPHADSRAMIISGTTLLEGDDGGIYRRDLPTGSEWKSMNSNLAITEFHSITFDPVNTTIFGGTQDVGTIYTQFNPVAPTNGPWSTAVRGDGGVVRVGVSNGVPTDYFGYIKFDPQYRGNITNATTWEQLSTKVKQWGFVLGTGGTSILDFEKNWDAKTTFEFYQKYELNAVNPNRILLGTAFLYESVDQGQTFSCLTGLAKNGVWAPTKVASQKTPNDADVRVMAVAYGGWEGIDPKEEIAYVATTEKKGLFLREAIVAHDFQNDFHQLMAYPGDIITDIVLDPKDWQRGYVIDVADHVWRFVNTGQNAADWTDITGNLLHLLEVSGFGGAKLRCIELYAPDAASDSDDVVLVGALGGVFRTLNPGPGAVWAEFGKDLPNALVMDIHYENNNTENADDDFLLAGLDGRGAWYIAVDKISTMGELIITADDALAATIELEIFSGNPSILSVGVTEGSTSTAYEFQLSTLQKISLIGQGENDTFTFDNSNGAIDVPQGESIDGGGGELQLCGAADNVDAGTGSVNISKDGRQQYVQYENLGGAGTPQTNITTQASLGAARAGTSSLGDATARSSALSQVSVGPLRFGEFFNGVAYVGGRVALDPINIGPAPTGGRLQGTMQGNDLFRRILASIGFSIDDIGGGDIADFDQLEAALEAAGAMAVLDKIDTDSNGAPDDYRFTVTMTDKIISGTATLDASALGGAISLGGELAISAQVDMNLVFGVDSQGFYLKTGATPLFNIDTISAIGEGGGRFGFLDVTLSGLSLTIDPNVKIAISLNDIDGTVRLEELDSADLFTVAITGNNNAGDGVAQDAVLTGTVEVAAILPGLGDPISLGSATLTLNWADTMSPLTPTYSVTGGFSDFLSINSQQIVDQLTALREQLTSLAQVSSAFGLDIPFVKDALQDILDVAGAVNEKLISPLSISGQAKFPTVQSLMSLLSEKLDVSLSDLGLQYEGGLLTFDLNFAKSVIVTDPLSVGIDLKEGLADLNFNANPNFTGTVGLDFTIGANVAGLVSGMAAAEAFFVKDLKVEGTASFNAAGLDGTARFGFLDIEVVGGSVTTTTPFAFTVGLRDPGTSAPDGRITLKELADNISSPINLLESPTIAGGAQMVLPIGVEMPFLTIAPSASTTVTVTMADINNPSSLTVTPDLSSLTDLSELLNFKNMTAGSFVSLLGKVSNWLDDVRKSDFFKSLDIPFAKTALDQVLNLAEMFSDTFLYNDGADDKVDGEDTLLSDINTALGKAGLGNQIIAEPDTGGNIRLVSIDRAITAFSVSVVSEEDQGGFDELTFGNGGNSTTSGVVVSLSATPPANGKLSGDAVFDVQVTKQVTIQGAVTTSTSTRKVTVSETADNTGIGDDKPRLLKVDNQATFVTVDGLAFRLACMLGNNLVGYDAVTDALTFNIGQALNYTLASIDVPIDFDFDLSPLLNITSDTMLKLDATIGFDPNMKLGAYLGSTVPGVTGTLSGATLLSDLGITVKEEPALTGDSDVRTVYGQVSGDATFKLTVDGTEYTVKLERGVTDGTAYKAFDGATAVDGDGNTLTISNHGLSNDTVVIYTNGYNTSIGGLSDGSTYYVIYVDPDTLKLAKTAGGAALDLTSVGAGTQRLTYKSGVANTSVAELAVDINEALPAAVSSKIEALADGNRLKLQVKDGATVSAFSLTAEANDPAVRDIGLGTSQSAVVDASGKLSITGVKDVSLIVGRLGGALNFEIVDVTDGNEVYSIQLAAEATADNRYIVDLVKDMQDALKKAQTTSPSATVDISANFKVESLGNRIILTALNGHTFQVRLNSSTGPVLPLGFSDSTQLQSNNDDLLIYLSNDSSVAYHVSLDGATTVQDIKTKIESATRTDPSNETTNQVLVEFPNGTNLVLTDRTFHTVTIDSHGNLISNPNDSVFMVKPINGCTAGLNLGIVGMDALKEEDLDGKITGAQLMGPEFADRFFIQDATLKGTVALSGAISAEAGFGFVGIGLTGSGQLNANLSVGLQDPGTGDAADGRITLAEMIEAIAAGGITSIVQAPQFTGSAALDLRASITGPFADLLKGSTDPWIKVELPDLAHPNQTKLTYGDLGDLLSFDSASFDFSAIIAGLRKIAEFLGKMEDFGFLNEPLPIIDKSFNDLLGYADKLTTFLDAFERNPAGSIQFLDQKLKEAFGLPADSETLRLSLDADGIGKFSETALFNLSVTAGGSVTSGSVTLDTAGDNTNMQDLVDDTNQALFDAGLSDLIIAEAMGHRLNLMAKNGAEVTEFTLTVASASDAAVTRLGFRQEQEAIQTGSVLSLTGNKEVANSILRLDLNLGAAFDERFGVNFDLSKIGVPDIGGSSMLGGSANLRATGSVDFGLALGVGISDPTKIYLYDYDNDPIGANRTRTGLEGTISASANGMNFRAGLGSLGIFVSDGTANIHGEPRSWTFNGASAVNTTNSTITINNHGLVTGTAVVYSKGSGEPIGGLTDGSSYYVIRVNENTIMLADSAEKAYSSNALPLTAAGTGANHSLSCGPLVSVHLKESLFQDHKADLIDLVSNFSLSDVVAEINGSFDATLPIYFPSESIFKGNIILAAGVTYDSSITDPTDPEFRNDPDDPTLPKVTWKLLDPSSTEDLKNYFTIDPNQFSLLDQILFAVDGLDAFLLGLQGVLGTDFAMKLPLIGDQLAKGADFIKDFREGFIEDFRTEVQNLDQPDKNIVSETLFNLLGPSGIGILLKDANHDGMADTDAYDNFLEATQVSDILLSTNIDTPGVKLEDQELYWKMTLGDNLVDAGADLDFDIGVPGLGIETQGDINLRVSWQLNLGFGFSGKDGFFIFVDSPDELLVSAAVTLPGAGLTGRLGFLQLSATDMDVGGDAQTTHLSAEFAIDLENVADKDKTPGDSSRDKRLGFSELSELYIDPKIKASASVELLMALGINSDLVSPGVAAGFPKVDAKFFLDWEMDDGSGGFLSLRDPNVEIGRSMQDGLKTIEFKDITLHAGSFISDVVAPLLSKIQTVTEPIQPIIDILTTPLPVISELGPPLTLLDLAASYGEVDPSLLYAVADVITTVNKIKILDSTDVGWNFGGFKIYDNAMASQFGSDFDLGSPEFNLDNFADRLLEGDLSSLLDMDVDLSTPEGIANAFKAASDAASKLLGDLIDKSDQTYEGGFSFPIFEDPKKIFGLLLGKSPTLVGYDMPPLEFEFEWSQFFPIFGPLGASINVEFAATIDFAFGFDTYGIQQFVSGGFTNPLLVLNGLFISDDPKNVDFKKDDAELVVEGGVWAAAECNLAVARFGVGGGIFAEIDFDLYDPNKDGKIRIGELLTNIENEWNYGTKALAPLAIFDVYGEITAKLFAFLKIDLFLFSIDKRWNITPPITLAEFDVDFARPPKLASELDNGVLQLNMGQFASERVNDPSGGAPVDDAEEFYVATAGSGQVNVWSPKLGIPQDKPQTYSAKTKIIAFGGAQDDIIDLSGVTDPSIAFEIEGGDGIDRIKTGAGQAVIKGGAGNDIIYGGSGNDIIYGDAGADEIHGGGGSDILFGDEGKISNLSASVESVAGSDADEIYGDEGDDILFGGGGGDTLDGGKGSDILIGDSGSVVFTNKTVQKIVGNVAKVEDTDPATGTITPFNDILYGGEGPDQLYGGKGDDRLDGGAGDDFLYGETGANTLYGGSGSDQIFGHDLVDIIYGYRDPSATYKDVSDTIPSDHDGNDIIKAGKDADEVHGGAGNDTIWGGEGADQLFGDAGDDIIYGESQDDTLVGGLGKDILDGGPGNDWLYGYTNTILSSYSYLANDSDQRDDDTLYGGKGADILDGQDGSDKYIIKLQRNITADLITNVIESGQLGVDTIEIFGTDYNDIFLLRASNVVDMHHDLTKPLALNVSPDEGTAFAALVNEANLGGTVQIFVQRVNYWRSMDGISINSRAGDDDFYVDDSKAAVTLNGGVGDDTFQIGQLYKSPRGIAAGVAAADIFATTPTTRGYLSNGNSETMTINGGSGDDTFVVFHNSAYLILNGQDGDDTFIIKTFALPGSTDKPLPRMYISGGGGNDFIQYVENAPVDIDGGEGFDTLVVTGTEFGDDFVVTENGIFGAGRKVEFVNIESMAVDGAEGNDRFFVLSTGDNFTTKISGGLGSDTFNISGDAPPVTANDLLGHSGVITHEVTSTDAAYDGLKVVGISANVGDNEIPFIRITAAEAATILTEGGPAASYTVVLSKEPTDDVRVILQAPALPEDEKAKGYKTIQFLDPLDPTKLVDNIVLNFNAGNWDEPQTVQLKAVNDYVAEGVYTGAISHKVESLDVLDGTATGWTPTTLTASSGSFPENTLAGLMVELTSPDGVKLPRYIKSNTNDTLTLYGDKWPVEPVENSTYVIKRYDSLVLPTFKFKIIDKEEAAVIISQSEQSTDVIEGGMTDTIEVSLTRKPTLDSTDPNADATTVTVSLDSGTQLLALSEPVVTGTVTSAEGATLGDSSASFSTSLNDPNAEYYVKITDGPGTAQIRKIIDQSDTVLTLERAWDANDQPTTASTYEVVYRVQIITFDGNQSGWDTAQTITVAAVDDVLVEGFHKGYINTTVTSPDGGKIASTQDAYPAVPESEETGMTSVLLQHAPLVISQGYVTTVLPLPTTNDPLVDPNWSNLYKFVDANADFSELQAGQLIRITKGGGKGLTRMIASVDAATHTITVDKPWARFDETGGTVTVAWPLEIPIEARDELTGKGSYYEIIAPIQVKVSHAESTPTYIDANRFQVISNTVVFLDKDGNPEEIRDSVTVYYTYTVEGYNNAAVKRITANVSDRDAAGVLVIQTNKSTDVIETSDSSKTDIPWTDTYTVVLTSKPSSDVFVTVIPEPTETSLITPAIVQVAVSSTAPEAEDNGNGTITLKFTQDNWNIAQEVKVAAIDDTVADGENTQVFAPGLWTVDNIQGPVFISGAGGDGSLAGLSAPYMLPGETNIKYFFGSVQEAGSDTVTVFEQELASNGYTNLADLVGKSLEITDGKGSEKLPPFRIIDSYTESTLNGDPVVILTFTTPWEEVPDGTSKYTVTQESINFFVNEPEMVDFLTVFDNDSIADKSGQLINVTPEESAKGYEDRLKGFGMGPDTMIGGRPQPGGITFGDLEVVTINLGRGSDNLDVFGTPKRDDGFQTWTIVNAGKGNDRINIDILAADDGLLAVNGQEGEDQIIASAATDVQLVAFGGEGRDEIAGGTADDLLFGDRGRIDYFDEAGGIVTRLGIDPLQESILDMVKSAIGATLEANSSVFPTTDNVLIGMVVYIIEGAGIGQSRVITGVDAAGTTLTLNTAWTKPLDTTSKFYIGTVPQDQTDGVVRAPNLLITADNEQGDVDTVNAGGGNDQIFGGAGGDIISAGGDDDVVIGDAGRIDRSRDPEAPATPAFGDVVGSFFDLMRTMDFTVGDNDIINGDEGNDILIGGTEDDTIDGGGQNDILLGDQGEITFVDGKISLVRDAGTAGDDILSGGVDPDLIIGGLGDDTISGDANSDILIGDEADITYDSDGITIVKIETVNRTNGGIDTIYGGDDDDIVIGGSNDDNLDGGAQDDLIFGDNVLLVLNSESGDAINPRFRKQDGINPIYDADGLVQIGSEPQSRPGGNPAWGDWTIMLDQSLEASHYGNDYIAGGAHDDEIFGQLGDDTIQGDGSIDSKVADGLAVSAYRDGNGLLQVSASVEASSDGDDYIEGNGGSDVIFGNLGQDDIIGGSSSLFSLITPDLRPDSTDLIFGGAGMDIARDDAGDGLNGRDSDMILGDNGNIYRIVDTEGFKYDDDYDEQIMVRAAELLDYTPGGPDFTMTVESEPADVAINPATGVRDIGSADEVHGESGDDFIYGMVGNDVLFGDGQNDVIIGGYGADWISGGTGDDGILGDDGRIFASRNSTSFGEPLYGIDAIPEANINELISTPDGANNAILNVNGALKYTADLMPDNLDPNKPIPPDPLFRPLYANDIIYGGWGNDSIHGGAGDDAISGAEAPELAYTDEYGDNGTKLNPEPTESDFAHPYNPGNVLGYQTSGVNATKFDLYDADDPLRKILLDPTDGTLNKDNSGLEWILNFSEGEGPVDDYWIQGQTEYIGVATDGDDHIFGDLGNDWLVGGTGRDTMFSGWGDDLLNMDDNLNSPGSESKKGNTWNPECDTNPSYEDLAFGGAGRDVLLINTNGDRAMDWIGEFNSFYTPFAQFGAVAVDRLLRPFGPELLYALSKSDGADQTLAAQYVTDPARNGEPFGELGLVLQKDTAWSDQSGAPRDPQPGNTGGGKVDLKNNPGTAGTLPIYATAAAPAPATKDAVSLLSDSQLAPTVAVATQLWTHSLGVGDSRLALLDNVQVEVGNLPQDRLAATFGGRILIDSDAAGYGWFIDPTPLDNTEFKASRINGELTAMASSPAFGEMDLLTVVMHEMGHMLGFTDLNPGTGVNDLMVGTLEAGVRHLPGNGNNGNSTSKTQGLGEESALVAMEARFDSLFAKGKINQNSWLMSYLLNGAENSYNSFGVNGDIRILLDPQETQKPNLRRVYGQRS
jgi:Ca2+-binding RTX toxin-like protein